MEEPTGGRRVSPDDLVQRFSSGAIAGFSAYGNVVGQPTEEELPAGTAVEVDLTVQGHKGALVMLPAGGNVLVIGIPARDFSPDIAIQATAESERQAYDALTNGADVTTLYTAAPGQKPAAVPLVVTIPGGAPTGQAFNPTTSFVLPDGQPALFVFAGEDESKPVIHPKAERLLTRMDKRSRHYRIAI